MGRENHDPTIVHSSIALLQERFRQLERVKEMREERELKRMLNEPKQQTYDQSTRLFSSNHELIIPSRSSPPHVSLSLWPTTSSQVKQQEEYYTSLKSPVSMNLCTTSYTQNMQANSWKNGYDCESASDSGVDTSLHL
ncbi:uncharacterized protein LOC127112435 [Lathyrus oleraceus]|uniref:uncharacterized protein LOC127112435 n=1 Tax=Pisum sativum TaxID=3888 RepID=UPI001FC4B4EE|nr:uncharacterized protein LOC127112435 [Pisum sativum]